MKQIIIEGPTFHGEEDENIFFHCIYSLPGFQNVKGAGTQLHIDFKDRISERAKAQIEVLCRRWGTEECC